MVRPRPPGSQTINRIAFQQSIKNTQNRLGSLEPPSQKVSEHTNKVLNVIRSNPTLVAGLVAAVCVVLTTLNMFTGEFAKRHLAEGIKKYTKHQYQQAKDELNAAIRLKHDTKDAYYYRALCHEHLGQKKEALDDFGEYLAYPPEDMDAYIKHVATAVRLRNDEKVVADYLHLLGLQPYIFSNKDSVDLVNLGISSRRLKNDSTGIQIMSKCLEMFPKNTSIYIERALCFQQQKKYGNAIADCTSALSVEPANVRALETRARTYQLKGDLVADLKDLKKTISLEKKNSTAYFYLALHSLQAGNDEKALQDLNTAISLAPGNSTFYRERSKLLASRGDLNGALRDCNKLATLEGFQPTAAFYVERGDLFDRLHQYANAIKNFQLASIADHRHASTYLLRCADCHAEMQQYGAAIKDCRDALAVDSNNANAMVKSGVFQTMTGNKLTALAEFCKAIQTNPNNADAYAQRGSYYFDNKQFSSAFADLSKAQTIQPGSKGLKEKIAICQSKMLQLAKVSAVYIKPSGISKAQLAQIASADSNQLIRLGSTAMQHGEFEFAVAALEKCVQLDSNNRIARRYLFSAYVASGDGSAALSQLKILLSMGSPLDDDMLMVRSLIRVCSEEQGREAFSQLITLNSKDPSALIAIANLCKSLGYSDCAIEACKTGLIVATNRQDTLRLTSLHNLLIKEATEQALAAKEAAREKQEQKQETNQ